MRPAFAEAKFRLRAGRLPLGPRAGFADESKIAGEARGRAGAARYFTRVDFDWNRPGCGRTTRAFFEVVLAAETVPSLSLREGADMRVIPAGAVQTLARVTPSDAFALWLHINRERIG